ncbi:hypothetical protein P9386_14020 [Caldifermentibacillus hisashii]|uniref:hypothetical protein n=1 Tax=Caldifermentibacillus hisashii TaxID=996558 RepID=UPI00190F98B3|nr:hypothetical protein [Caldifermentibacillus hisashii]MED4852928.1 hypothetical protein [Caldifermentibacillus hisashii]
MTTRKGLVAKKWGFPCKNDDEKGPRRQKMGFPVQKRRREGTSSPKISIFRFIMVTRKESCLQKRVQFSKICDKNGFL